MSNIIFLLLSVTDLYIMAGFLHETESDSEDDVCEETEMMEVIAKSDDHSEPAENGELRSLRGWLTLSEF